jgi:hypothetical protein
LTISNENSFEVSQIKNRSSNHKCSDKNLLTHPLRLSIGGSAGMLVSKVFVAEGTLYLAREGRNGIEGKVREKKRKRKQYQCITHEVVRIFVTVFVVNDSVTVFRLQMRTL